MSSRIAGADELKRVGGAEAGVGQRVIRIERHRLLEI